MLLFVRILDREEVLGHLQRITVRTVAGVLAFQLLIQALATFQWALVLREAGIFRGAWRAFAARIAGFAVTYLTPSMYFGGEPVRASVYKAASMSYRRLYATIVLDKYIELSTKFPCIIAGFAVLVVLIHPSIVLVSVVGAVLAFFLGFFVLLVARLFNRPDLVARLTRRLARPVARLNRRLAVKMIVVMKEFARDVAGIMAHRRVFYLAMLTGVTVSAVEVLQTFFILGEIDPSWQAVERLVRSFAIFATVFIQALVGLLPGNLGGMEGTHLVIFNVLGIGFGPQPDLHDHPAHRPDGHRAAGDREHRGWRARRARGTDRRRSESNRCIKVLQTSPLPLGYGAPRNDRVPRKM